MNRNMAIRRLWWKELRQLVPLIGLLLLVGLLLMLVSLGVHFQRQEFQLAVLLGMPCLFAAGAGGLLVGQEKELRTLDWLRTLPVPRVDVIRSKLLAAILGLVAVWLVSLGLALTVGALNSSSDGSWVIWVWLLYSLYLLLVGFATAWQLRSSLVSLLLVVPLASVPLLLANLHERVLPWGRFNRDPEPWLMGVYIGMVGVGVLVWGWRAAMTYMSPERSSVTASKHRAHSAPAALVMAPRSSPAPALLWQFYAQNRSLFIGLAAVLIACSYALLRTYAMLYAGAGAVRQLQINGLFGFFTTVPIFLSVSWLGLLVFQTDTLQRRSQFLADRGVSPRLTWLTRQAFPWLALVVAATIALFVGREFLANVGVLLQMFVLATGIAIFGASQWLGQTLRSVILSAIIAPLVSLIFVGYLTHAVWSLVAPPWIIAVTLVIPLIATFGATAAWMYGRTGWRFWTWHSCMLALVVLLPSLNYAYLLATYPQISAAYAAKLTRISAQLPPTMEYRNYSLSLRGNPPVEIETSSPAETESQLTEPRLRSFAALRKRMDVDSAGLANAGIVKSIASDAILNRLSDPTATDDERVQHYRESLGLIVELTKRQRRSLRLLDQDWADDYEMLLLEEMQLPLARPRIGDELHASITKLLSDKVGRDAARRDALGASWRDAQPTRHFGQFDYAPPTELGGYDLVSRDMFRMTPQLAWEASRKVGLVSEHLLQLLEATSDAERDLLRSKIYALMDFKEPPNISSGAYLQTADGPKLLYGELGGWDIPGRAWHGDWERRAASLRTASESEAEASESEAEASE